MAALGNISKVADPQLLQFLGMGLMSGAKYGGNLGDGLMQGIQGYQQNRAAQQQRSMQQLQMQRMQAQLPIIQAASRYAQGQPPLAQGAPQGAQGVPAPQGAPAQSMPPQASAAPPQQGLMGGGNGLSTMGMGALMDMGGIGGQGLTELGKAQLQYDPGMATRMESAKSAVAVDQQQIQQAQAQGNHALAQAIYNGKLQQDLGLLHISSMGGIQTRINPGSGVISTLNPSSGIESTGNQASLMPGMSVALQQKAAAEAQGEATGQVEEVTDSQGNTHFINKAALLGGQAKPGGSRPTTPPAAASTALGPFAQPGTAPAATVPGGVAKLGPGTTTMLHGNAESAIEANKEYQTQAEGGQQMLAQTQELRQAANDFSPGQFAETRMKTLQYLNSAGLITPDQMKSLGSAQEGQKIAIQLQAAATKQLGSREAAQIFQYMGKSLPNLTLSQNGLDKVSGYMDGIARYNMARAQVAQQRGSSLDVNGVNNVRNDFIQNSNPLYFVVASSPPAIQKEIVQSMGQQGQSFVNSWRKAAGSGWAPKPSQYWGANATP
jgi:hypothetical protein